MKVSTKTLTVQMQNTEFSTSIEFNGSQNLLELLNASKVSISQSCDGNGTCTTCRVLVIENLDSFGDRTEIECERATERSFLKSERLACQCEINNSAEIKIVNRAK